MQTITLAELTAKLRALGDVRRAIEAKGPEIAAIAVEETKDRMAWGKAPDGSDQPPLRGPRRSGNTGPPLVDYGDLLNSVTARMDGTTLIIEATGPGAARHQRDRPFLGMSDKLEFDLLKVVADAITEHAFGPGG